MFVKVSTTIAAEPAPKPLRPSSSNCSSDSYSGAGGAGGAVFRLPAATRETLSRMLDAPVSIGNDWRMLAERLR